MASRHERKRGTDLFKYSNPDLQGSFRVEK